MGLSVLGYAAAGNLLVTISADGEVAAAAAGPGNMVMVVLQDGRVQFFDRWGNLLGRDHVQMHPYQASWENGKFCVFGWDAGQSEYLCGDPLEGEPFGTTECPGGGGGRRRLRRDRSTPRARTACWPPRRWAIPPASTSSAKSTP